MFLRAALLLLVFNAIAVEGSFRLCGFRLTMTLTAICKNQICGGYVASPAKRRSPDTELYERADGRFAGEDAEADAYELGDSSYYDELMPRERRSVGAVSKRAGGIATECCEKRCTLAYLKTFCCAALQLPSAGSGAGPGITTATTKSGGSSKSVAALVATSKKTTARQPAMAFVSSAGDSEDEPIGDLLVVR